MILSFVLGDHYHQQELTRPNTTQGRIEANAMRGDHETRCSSDSEGETTASSVTSPSQMYQTLEQPSRIL